MTDDTDATRPTRTDPAPTTGVATASPAPPTDAPLGPPAATALDGVAVAPVVVRERSASGRWVNLLLGAAVVLAVGGVAFAIGRSTAPATALGPGALPGPDGGVVIDGSGSFDPGVVPGGGQGRPGLGGAAFVGAGSLAIDGTVTAVDGSTLTIELATGETTTVTLDASTTYHEATETDAEAVAVGDDVSIRVSMDGGPRAGTGGDAPRLTASDVTVTR
jgi:hypothetical protein